MILFPAIDMKDGKCVRLIQGDFNKSTTYNNSPLDQAKLFEDLGITWLHCVDLDGALAGQSENVKSIEEIALKTKLKLQFGGGIRNINSVETLVNIGIQNVILGTAAFEDYELFQTAVYKYPNKISIALDIKNEQIALRGWSEVKSINLEKFLLSIEGLQINSIICTDVMRDGMKKGINFDMLENVMKMTSFLCVASGGVSSINDIKNIKGKNYSQMKGVIVGKAIYDKNIDIKDALKILSK